MVLYYLQPCAKSLRDVIARHLSRSLLPEIIVNHADEDSGLASEVYELLRAEGWSVVTNRQLPVGQRLDDYLETALASTKCVVTLWTSSSVGSPRVRDVANEALRMGVSVPVLAESVLLPLGHRSVKNVDWTGFSNQVAPSLNDRLVRSVQETMDGILDRDSMDEEATDYNPSLSVRIARRVIESLSQDSPRPPTNKVSQSVILKIGEWTIDAGANALRSVHGVRKIQPRAMEVLVFLVSRAPETTSIEEILDVVWDGRLVVDSAVHRCIRELRQALDDDAKEPSYIETIARRGYRILADVTVEDQRIISDP